MHPVSMTGGLAIDRLHQEEFQIIGDSQVAWHTALCYRLLPESFTTLRS